MVEAQYQAQVLCLRPDLAIEWCSAVYLYSFCSINLVLKSHCGLYTQRSNTVSLGRHLGQRSPPWGNSTTIVLGQQQVGQQVSSWVKILCPSRYNISKITLILNFLETQYHVSGTIQLSYGQYAQPMACPGQTKGRNRGKGRKGMLGVQKV